MRKTLYMMLAVIGLMSCERVPQLAEPTMEIDVVDVSSTGCVVNVSLGAETSSYLMKVVPASEFNESGAEALLDGSAPFTVEKRVIERLHGHKDFVVVARPVSKDLRKGKVINVPFRLTDLDMEVLLYTPGAETGDLNRYNSLGVIAFSNGLAASGRCALALNDAWRALKAEKGLQAAAEQVLGNNCVEYTKQQLEEIADRNELKRDLMNYGELEEGTTYTYIVCLVDLDGARHYFAFDGSTKKR